MSRKKDEADFWELYRILHELLDAELFDDIDWREELELELEELEERIDAAPKKIRSRYSRGRARSHYERARSMVREPANRPA